jgi:chromosome segregation ATPase
MTMGATARFRRSLFGYRRRDVDGAIAEREAALEAGRAEVERGARRIRELDRVSAWLAERVVDRERELREVRVELAQARERGDEGLRALSALADDLEAVRRQARGQATRIRLRALREAAELAGRMGELGDDPNEAREALVESLREAIERVGADADEDDGRDLPGLMAGPNGSGVREPAKLFEGMVEVEVGPLSDFSQLVGF